MEKTGYGWPQFNSRPSYPWWGKERVLDSFDIGEKTLEEWVEKEFIGFTKTGDRSLYATGDIDVILKTMSSDRLLMKNTE